MRRRVIHAPAMDPATLLQMGLLILAFVTAIGIGLIIIDKVRRAMAGDDPDSPSDPLSVFRKSLEKGEMDEAEFRRITASLTKIDPDFSSPQKGSPPKDFPPPSSSEGGSSGIARPADQP